MAEEQPPTLTEERQEEVTSPSSSEAAEDNQTSAKGDGTQESHTTPEEISKGKTEKDTEQEHGLDEDHQRDGQPEAKEEAAEEGDRGGDTVTSGGDATEDSVTSDGDKASQGANEESSSTQEESADDSSGHKEDKSEASAGSPEVAAGVDGKSEGEQAKPSAKDKSKSAASSVKDGAAATPAAGEKERDRKSDIPRAKTMPKSYGRATKKDIAEKFGGVATSGIRVQRSTSCGANAVKNMLLEWCRAKTRGREGVDIQNFSSSWSSGLAFCALIVAFFPDAFDYDSLDPKNRRQNFQLAFNAAEKFADCPPLLDVEDMVRMKVPDSKCVYTYVQELYRSLVAKGLVKTKKA